ncbi:MAG: LytTR family DNA-binding domain-containing protein [Raoultibacter sp.]|jgi:two-component system response regulator LytT
MKVSITENPRLSEVSVDITCPQINETVSRIVANLNTFNNKLIGKDNGQTHILSTNDIFYFETVDRKTFMYTHSKVFETPLRIYELMERFEDTEFIQISKQMIVNFDKVIAVRPEFNARLQLILPNNETVIVSRQFSPYIKRKLGTIG